MRNRSKAREAVLQALYQMDVTGAPLDECAKRVSRGEDDGEEITGAAAEYFETLFFAITERLEGLDELIEKYSDNWSVKRMTVVDRNVLRLAVYELSAAGDIPFRVVIDEAVELAKRFGTEESSAFVNGILDKIAKEKASKQASAD
jgi:N utilization substance protein B